MTKRRMRAALTAAGVMLTAAPAAEAGWSYDEAACQNEYSAPNFLSWMMEYVIEPALPTANAATIQRINQLATACKDAQPDPIEKARIDACLRRPIAYITWMRTKPRTHALGLAVDPTAAQLVPMSNADYLARYGPQGDGDDQNQLSIPGCLADPAVFQALAAVNLGQTPANTDTKQAQAANGMQAAEQAITHACDGAIVLPYITTQTQGLDALGEDKHGRVIVAYKQPGDTGREISHYVQFTVNAKRSSVQARVQASVVNVIPEGLGEPGAHVFDWKRNNQQHTFGYDPNFGNDQQCSQCHLSGMLEIHPFGTGLPDVMSVGDTLDNDWPARIDALNAVWAANLESINRRVRSEYKRKTAVLHGLRADIINDPALRSFPDLYTLNKSWTHWGEPRQGGTMQCADLIREVAVHTETPGGMHRCSACHAQRGRAVMDAWNLDAGWTPLMTKYVYSGMMPPNHDAYRQPVNGFKRIINTIIPNDDGKFERLGQCLQLYAQNEIKTWMGAWLDQDGCNMF